MCLVLGLVVGREGPGGFPLSNYLLARTLGIIALIIILHAGGLGTTLSDVRSVRGSALVLSTIGVVVATVLGGSIENVSLLHVPYHGATVTLADDTALRPNAWNAPPTVGAAAHCAAQHAPATVASLRPVTLRPPMK